MVPSRPRFLHEARRARKRRHRAPRRPIYAAEGLYNQRHYLVALFVPRVVVVAPVEGDVTLACFVVKGREAAPRGGLRRLVTGAAPEDLAVQPLLGVTESH